MELVRSKVCCRDDCAGLHRPSHSLCSRGFYGDRGFESVFLQRRVGCELIWGRGSRQRARGDCKWSLLQRSCAGGEQGLTNIAQNARRRRRWIGDLSRATPAVSHAPSDAFSSRLARPQPTTARVRRPSEPAACFPAGSADRERKGRVRTCLRASFPFASLRRSEQSVRLEPKQAKMSSLVVEPELCGSVVVTRDGQRCGKGEGATGSSPSAAA